MIVTSTTEPCQRQHIGLQQAVAGVKFMMGKYTVIPIVMQGVLKDTPFL